MPRQLIRFLTRIDKKEVLSSMSNLRLIEVCRYNSPIIKWGNALKLREWIVITSLRSNLKYPLEMQLNNRLLQFFAGTNLNLRA